MSDIPEALGPTAAAHVGGRAGADRANAAAYLAAAVLALVYTLNFLDRQLLTVLAPSVKADLRLTDTELGLLTGPAFALFYTFFGIPVAALADRFNRVRIIALACTIWSLFSAGCGLATGFFGLALARMGVGLGEAGGAPPSYSAISDYFPARQRGVGLGILVLGVPMGTMFGAALGGFLAVRFGWRVAFFVVGGCGGIAVPLLLLTVREPSRGGRDAAGRRDGPSHPLGLRATLSLFLRTPKLLLTALSAGLTTFAGYGLLNWGPSWLQLEEGMSLSEVAAYYSLVAGASSAVGTYFSGALVDRIGQARPSAYALVPGLSMVLALPFFIWLLHAPDWRIALLLMPIPSICLMTYLAPGLSVVQNAVRSERRGVAGALYLFVLNLIGLGGGPLFVGWMSDRARSAGLAHPVTHGLLALSPVFVLAFLAQAAAAVCIRRDDRTGL